mmetsp:Transcript_92848/g.145887  ORF Transcript_92848/g.145887 Transcript_92848/m.145887 type:complete len:84 (+) Transcript_92848:108-359(+)
MKLIPALKAKGMYLSESYMAPAVAGPKNDANEPNAFREPMMVPRDSCGAKADVNDETVGMKNALPQIRQGHKTYATILLSIAT